MTKLHRDNIPFFNDLPTKAFAVAARLWDAAKRPDYNGPIAYRDFVQDLNFQKVTPPPRAVVNRWVAGVQAGMIDRPGGSAEQPAATVSPRANAGNVAQVEAMVRPAEGGIVLKPEVVTGEDPVTRRVFHTRKNEKVAAQPEAYETLTTDAYESLLAAGVLPKLGTLNFLPAVAGDAASALPDPALLLIREQMVNEVVAQINFNARAQAVAIVAARFRRIADDLESANS